MKTILLAIFLTSTAVATDSRDCAYWFAKLDAISKLESMRSAIINRALGKLDEPTPLDQIFDPDDEQRFDDISRAIQGVQEQIELDRKNGK